jgi:hypothetical protein
VATTATATEAVRRPWNTAAATARATETGWGPKETTATATRATEADAEAAEAGRRNRNTIVLQNVELPNAKLQNAEFQNIKLQNAELQDVESYRMSNLTKRRNTKHRILHNVKSYITSKYKTSTIQNVENDRLGWLIGFEILTYCNPSSRLEKSLHCKKSHRSFEFSLSYSISSDGK